MAPGTRLPDGDDDEDEDGDDGAFQDDDDDLYMIYMCQKFTFKNSYPQEGMGVGVSRGIARD